MQAFSARKSHADQIPMPLPPAFVERRFSSVEARELILSKDLAPASNMYQTLGGSIDSDQHISTPLLAVKHPQSLTSATIANAAWTCRLVAV